jgi:hypothetical protein
MSVRLTCAAVALAAIAAPALAERTIDAAATTLGDNTSEVHRVSDEHVVVWSLTELEPLAAEDAESPLNGLGGPCFGQVEVKGEEASGGGYCTWTDGDGDTLVVRWTATEVGEEGESASASLNASFTKGEWTAVSGTGKWAGATGGGTFDDREDIETGRRIHTLSGQVTLP